MEKDLTTSIQLIHERLNKLEASMGSLKGLEGRKQNWDTYDDLWGFEKEAEPFLKKLSLYKETSPDLARGGIEKRFKKFRESRPYITKSERDHFQLMILKVFPTQRDAFNKEVMNAFWKIFPPEDVIR